MILRSVEKSSPRANRQRHSLRDQTYQYADLRSHSQNRPLPDHLALSGQRTYRPGLIESVMSDLLEQLGKALDTDDGTLAAALQDKLDAFEFTPTRQEAVLIPTEDGGLLIPDIDEFSEATNSIAVVYNDKGLSVLDRETHKWRDVKPKGGKLTAIKGTD